MHLTLAKFEEGNVLKELVSLKQNMTLDAQGLELYFHHLIQLFGSPLVGDNLYDNLKDKY